METTGPFIREAILFAAQCVFSTADSVLDFASQLFSLAVCFQFCVAGQFTSGFFDGACGLLARTFDTIFIHGVLLIDFVDVTFVKTNGSAAAFVPYP